jgi:ATP-dependent DNA ligase
LFSRKIKNVADNFIGLKEAFDALDIPPFSIVDFEAVIGGGYTQAQYVCISSMSPNTKPKRAKEILDEWNASHQEKDGIGAIVFDVLFWNSEATVYQQYKDRYELVSKICPFTDKEIEKSENRIVRPHNYTNLEEAIKDMKDSAWEGLILWDNELHSDYSLNGKPRRPKGCYKWKNARTADVFVIEPIPQEGNEKLVGALNVGQYNETGDIINCGNVGSGLTDETRIAAWNWKDQVITVEFNERLEPNDEGQICFLFPRIVELRKDKSKNECIYDEDEQ